MKHVKSGLMLLSAALMSSGCEQRTSENFNSALALAKAKMNGGAASEVVMACSTPADHSAELVRLRQQLQQAQQQLAQANTALVAAKNQLKAAPAELTPQAANPVTQKQVALSLERRVNNATSSHIKQLEQRLTEQDLQLSELHQSMLHTEAGCLEIADELARKNKPS